MNLYNLIRDLVVPEFEQRFQNAYKTINKKRSNSVIPCIIGGNLVFFTKLFLKHPPIPYQSFFSNPELGFKR